jgi:hypothetical protein
MSRSIRGSLVSGALLWGMLAAVLTGCASTASNGPTGTPTATSLPAGTVLYKGDWSQGLSAWKATDGFKVDGNFLVSNTQDKRSLTIPYTPTVANYAIEFQLQVVSVPKEHQSDGYFTLQAPIQQDRDGWTAEVDLLADPGSYVGTTGAPELFTRIDSNVDQNSTTSYSVHDFIPRATVRTYRAEIHGNDLTYLVDSRSNGEVHSTNTKLISNGPITFSCGYTELRLGNITITAL